MGRIDAENFQLLAKESELLERADKRGLFGMGLDVGQKLRGGELAFDHIAFELGHINAIGGEAAERLIERRRHIAHPENKACHDGAGGGIRPLWAFRKHHKTGRVMQLVFDVGRQYFEAVDFGGETRCNRRAARIGPFSDFTSGRPSHAQYDHARVEFCGTGRAREHDYKPNGCLRAARP
jgi:hypothetical protein